MFSALAIRNSTRLGSLLDWCAAKHSRAAAILAAVSFLFFLPGFFALPPIDRDEARFAQASKQMLETGDYVDIRFQEIARHKKPVGIYWLQAGAVKAAEAAGVPQARAEIAVYRLPSLAGAIGIVLLTYWAALAFVSRRYALLAAFFMAGSVLLGVEARLAKTDAMLGLTAVAAMGSLARVFFASMQVRGLPPANLWINAAIFWTAIAGSILLKGPVVPFFIALAIATLMITERSMDFFRKLKPLTGLLWTLLLVTPWFVAVMARSDGAFMQESMGQDLIGKLFTGQESHGAPPGFYWLLFWVTFWPAAPLAAMATDFAWRERWQAQVRFLIAWILPAWIVLEAVATKLPHYVLPLYPAVAILFALALEKRAEISRLAVATLVLWPLMAAAFAAAAIFVSHRYAGGIPVWLWIAALASVASSAAAFILFRKGARESGLAFALLASAVSGILLFSVLPKASGLFLSTRIVTAAKTVCEKPQIASAGFNEPSLVFLGGTDVKFISGAAAAEFLKEPGCRIAAISQRELEAFRQAVKSADFPLREIIQIKGFNYSDGREAEVFVFARAGAGR